MRPSESRLNHGPLLPWAVQPQMYGCEWQVETSWNPNAEHWELWLGLEGTFVGSCHLDADAWRMGLFRIVDPEGMLDPRLQETVEAYLARAFLEWVISCAGRDNSKGSPEELSVEEEILDFVVEREYFGLGARILRAVSAKHPWTRQRSKIASLVAEALADPTGTKSELETALQTALQWKTRPEILEAIATAFEGATMPSTALELTTGGIDGPCVIRNFFGKHQDEVASFFQPSVHMEDFTYMTLMAVEYYLPSVLRLMMSAPEDDELWLFLRGFLKSRLEMRRRFGGPELHPKQLQAISEWASYMRNEWETCNLEFMDPGEAESLALAYRQ